ncbi:hypothetical protein [Streptosporangium amethystogenes]|uniref:hypothetical protein n=1 Tax=Streptosporangium amethystogenes TaxID=2002 RepID=UPI0004C55CF6|nr:hypothetical protein [Streptosporangium amethystogenes]
MRAADCRIAATLSLPTTSVAHAVNVKMTTSGCRKPQAERRPGTAANRRINADSTMTGSAVSSASHNARSASWSRAGTRGELVREDGDTSATPATIFGFET